LWANLIGLEQNGEVVAGVANCPAQNTLCWASKGGGSFTSGIRNQVSSISDPSLAVICFNGFHKTGVAAMGQPLLDWITQVWSVRGFGGAMDALFVAMGKADIWIEPKAKPWDFAPLKIIVEEAGGKFASFAGENTIYGGNGYACAPGLERFAKDLFTK
jgi:fructose-1,6-bisphosphatase/inositol monophosphatase family enzyme